MSTAMRSREWPSPQEHGAVMPSLLAWRGRALIWFVSFMALVFVVPFVGTDLLEMHHDLFYLVHATVVFVAVGAVLAHVPVRWTAVLRKNLGWSVVVGVAVAAAAVKNLTGDASTPHPKGAFFAFELVWRGVVYGVVDAVALFAFPALIAYVLVGGNRTGFLAKARYGVLTLILALAVTATYHLGYSQFRTSDIRNPELGALVFSVPAIITGNPAGALLAHGAVHAGAVVHEYYGSDPGFLPPKLRGYEDRWGGATAWALGGAWVALVGIGVFTQRRRLFPRRATLLAHEDSEP